MFCKRKGAVKKRYCVCATKPISQPNALMSDHRVQISFREGFTIISFSEQGQSMRFAWNRTPRRPSIRGPAKAQLPRYMASVGGLSTICPLSRGRWRSQLLPIGSGVRAAGARAAST